MTTLTESEALVLNRVTRLKARVDRINHCVDRARKTEPFTKQLQDQVVAFEEELQALDAEITFRSFNAKDLIAKVAENG